MSWTKAWPDPGEAGAGYWSSGAAEAGGSVSGGSSETQEDSTPSAYDNLDKESRGETKAEEVSGHFESKNSEGHTEEEVKTRDSSSSWSSCEVLPLDEHNVVEDVSPDMSPQTLKRSSSRQEVEDVNTHDDNPEDTTYDNDVHVDDGVDVQPLNSPASCSVLSLLSTGSSEVFLPPGPPESQGSEPKSRPKDAQSLLAELKQQMIRQRTEYQARIQR